MFCRNCGKEFEGKFCPNCGNQNEQDSQYVNKSTSKNDFQSIKKPKKTWLTIAIVLFVVSVIFAMTGMETTSAIGSTSLCGAVTYLIFGIVKYVKKQPSKSMFIGMAVCVVLMIGSANAEVKPKENDAPIKTVASSSDLSKEKPKQSSQEEQPENEVIAKIGETLDYNNLKLTLDSVTQYKDESQIIMDEADAGNVFILFNFTATNETGKDEFINMFFEDSYCDDISIDPEAILFNAKGETIWGDIANGKKRKGYVAYQVPADWETIEFYYNAEIFGGDSSKMMFKATPNDLL